MLSALSELVHRGFSKLNLSTTNRAEKRQAALRQFEALLIFVKEQNGPFIDLPNLELFNIKLEISDPENTEGDSLGTEWNKYFQPLSPTQLAKFPIDRDRRPEARRRLDSFDRKAEEPRTLRPYEDKEGPWYADASYFACRADYYFVGAPRVNIGTSVRTVSKWLPTGYGEGGIFRPEVLRYLKTDGLAINWDVTACYNLGGDENDRPHVMFVLHHGNTAMDLQPLRGELLSLLETMVTRLTLPEFENHVVVPVMIISVASTEGRIIQAHWNGEQLVICMSPLYYLKTKEMTAYDLFVRYMASDPVGNTVSIPPSKRKVEK